MIPTVVGPDPDASVSAHILTLAPRASRIRSYCVHKLGPRRAPVELWLNAVSSKMSLRSLPS